MQKRPIEYVREALRGTGLTPDAEVFDRLCGAVTAAILDEREGCIDVAKKKQGEFAEYSLRWDDAKGIENGIRARGCSVSASLLEELAQAKARAGALEDALRGVAEEAEAIEVEAATNGAPELARVGNLTALRFDKNGKPMSPEYIWGQFCRQLVAERLAKKARAALATNEGTR